MTVQHTRAGAEPELSFPEAVLPALIVCEQLIADSFARADANRRATVADLFVEDGWQRLGPELMEGRESIRTAMGARDSGDRRTMHSVSDLRATAMPTEHELHVSYNLTLYVLTGPNPCVPQSLASVEDVFVSREQTWWLQSRQVSVRATAD